MCTDVKDDDILQYMSNATGIRYSDEQLQVLKHRGGACIVACAGSGKTTTLTHLIAKRILTGEIRDTNNLLCTTYSRAGKNEMENRLGQLFNTLNIRDKVQVRTMHSTYYSVLKRFGLNAEICQGGLRERLVKQAIKEARLNLEQEEIQMVDSLLSFQVNNLLSDEALSKSYVFNLETVDREEYTQIRDNYCRLKQTNGVIDFDDMQMYMYTLLVHSKNQELINYCRKRWSYFFVDEFQDISKIQFSILRVMATDPDKLVVIGDDDQCIYQWRGADPSIILNICGYYDIQKFILGTNYRCSSNIVDVASVGIRYSTMREDKQMKAYNQGGSIKIYGCDTDNMYDFSVYTYRYIMGLIRNNGVGLNEIAVLCKNNKHACILSSMFTREGIKCELSSDEMMLTHNDIYKDVRAVLELSQKTYNVNLVHKILWKMCRYLGVKNTSVVTNVMKDASLDFQTALGYVLKVAGLIRENSEGNILGELNIPDKVRAETGEKMYNIKSDTLASMYQVYNALLIEDEYKKINKLMQLYLNNTEFLMSTADKRRHSEGICTYISALLKRDGLEDTIRFLNSLESIEANPVDIAADKITISTMHGAKGREWSYVVLFANDNITAPSFDGIKRMLTDGVSLRDISSSIDEDRRLNYVSWTRAKKELMLISYKYYLSVLSLENLGIIGEEDIAKFNRHIIDLASRGTYSTMFNAEIGELYEESSKYAIKLDGNGEYALYEDEDDEVKEEASEGTIDEGADEEADTGTGEDGTSDNGEVNEVTDDEAEKGEVEKDDEIGIVL